MRGKKRKIAMFFGEKLWNTNDGHFTILYTLFSNNPFVSFTHTYMKAKNEGNKIVSLKERTSTKTFSVTESIRKVFI